MNINTIITIFSIIFLFNINAYGNNIEIKQDYFKIEKNNNEIINKEDITILDINNNKIGNKNWSTAVILNNGNLLVGEYKENNSYDYYEVNKQGEQSFIINSKYYIKDVNNQTGNFITVSNENENYYIGVLDKEFNVIFDTVFYYKENAFKEYNDILKLKNNKYGIFTIEGNIIIEPIFDSINKINNDNFECLYNNKKYIIKKIDGIYLNETTLNSIPNWAKNSVEKAIKLNFISQNLQLKLNENITRLEFCELLIKLYEQKTGFKIDIDINNPFIDTNNIFVLKAYKLGIVSGKSKNTFEPNKYITREEAAVILSNLIKIMEYSYKEIFISYNDENLISSWAKLSTQIVSNIGIMTGDTKNNFNPQKNYKVVEAISTIMRLYDLK